MAGFVFFCGYFTGSVVLIVLCIILYSDWPAAIYVFISALTILYRMYLRVCTKSDVSNTGMSRIYLLSPINCNIASPMLCKNTCLNKA